MKKIISVFLFGLVLAFSSCNNDACADTICGEHAVCQKGTCKCEPGYKDYGNKKCVSILAHNRKNFVGLWKVREQCSDQNYTFNSAIVENPTNKEQIILHMFGNPIYANMVEGSVFEVPAQLIDRNRSIIQGIGRTDGHGHGHSTQSITLTYSLKKVDRSRSSTCTATFTK